MLALYDFASGKLLQTIEDAHSYDCSVLHIRYTDSTNSAIFLDNGGSVFLLETKSTLGRRNSTSACIFSGSKGEAFAVEPLRIFDKFPLHRFSETSVVAVASLNKVIIAEIKPALRSVFSFPINATPLKLPLLEWHIVTIQSSEAGKTIEPVLAVATGNGIVFVQVSAETNRTVKCSFIQRTTVPADVVNMKWLNNYIVAVVDIDEKLHIIDIRNQNVLDSVDLSFVGVVYQSSFFKGLATTRAVSQAMALAGNRACSQSIGTFQGQMVFLGVKGVFVASLRMWFERVERLVSKGMPLEALRFVLDVYTGTATGVLGLTRNAVERKGILRRQVRNLIQMAADRCLKSVPVHGKIDSLKEHYEAVIPLCIEACVSTGDLEYLFGPLYEKFAFDVMAKSVFLQCLEPLILNDELHELSPIVSKDFIELYESRDQFATIESCIVRLDVTSFDIHQVVSVCRQYDLFDGLAYVYLTAFKDARTPLEDYLLKLRKEMKDKPHLPDEIVALGNKVIVYMSCCLNGLKYPSGIPNDDRTLQIAVEVFQTLLARHTRQPDSDEPVFAHLRTLLDFNARETLNVFVMAFNQPYFNDAKGLELQQQLVDRLQQVVVQSTECEPGQVAGVFTFIARQMTKPDAKIVINRMLIEQTLEVLCDPDDRQRHDERESAVIELYDSGVLKHISDKTVIKMAEDAKFFRLCEVLYEKHNMHDKLLGCFLDDVHRKSQVFKFLQRVFVSPLYEKHDKKLVKEMCVTRFRDLLAIDRQKAAQLTVTSLWNEVPLLLKTLEPDVQQQYIFMRSLYDFMSRIPFGAAQDTSAFPPQYHDIFIELMCQVRPDVVGDHIRFNDDYDPDKVLAICRKYGLVKPEAYLLEKKGDTSKALEVLLDDLDKRIQAYLVSQAKELSPTEYIRSLREMSESLILLTEFCQRIGSKMDHDKREKTWLIVLERMLEAIRRVAAEVPEERKSDLRRLCVDFLKSMTGQVDLLVLLKKILEDPAYNRGKFGELRELLLGIVDAYTYEEILLSSTRNLLHKDIHNQMSRMKRAVSKALSAKNDRCLICDASLLNTSYSEPSESSNLAIFRCGHGFHTVCVKNVQSPLKETSQTTGKLDVLKCPECPRR
ncbi:vacuolar protein sorting-associated protein 8 homolog isoform X2 [Paramacrobiotus metropolitanus]|nr:vacuolar protein sorting-associated protein 8 homolog isoform X2 [Paramacrobiotus metropolitanus]